MDCSTTDLVLSNGTRGWVRQSSDRGTIDILISCLVTVFLCIWTSVCINVPGPEHTTWTMIRDRFHLFCLVILGPEFTMGLAVGQYSSAKASVELFKDAGCKDWTIKHGFFTDMGGIHLKVSDLPPFPITSEQLHFLVTREYIPYPSIPEATINDKNKSDGLARLIAFIQMFWFTLTTISRPIKGYATTTLEITTLAYILCACATLDLWRHKPMDVQDPLVLHCETPLEQIVNRHGRCASEPFRFTPLDFVGREMWLGGRIWIYYVNILRKLRLHRMHPNPRPIRKVRSFNWMVPDVPLTVFTIAASLAYTAIFLAPWNFHFPTAIERLLWRICSVGTLCVFLIGATFEHRLAFKSQDTISDLEIPAPVRSQPLLGRPRSRWQRFLQNARNLTVDKDPYYDIPIRTLLFTVPLTGLYCLFRLYIIGADFITLRELPASTFMAIQWSMYVPHILDPLSNRTSQFRSIIYLR